MPGWVRESGRQTDLPMTHEQSMAHEGEAPDAGGAAQAFPSGPAAPIKAAKAPLTQSQRDELLAEVLGDVLQLSNAINDISTQLENMGRAMTSQDFVRWRNTLDLKMTELSEINLSDQAAKRLQSVASVWVEQLSRETNTLVQLQAKRAVGDTLAFNRLFDRLQREWLMRIGMLGTVCFASTLLAHLVWSLW